MVGVPPEAGSGEAAHRHRLHGVRLRPALACRMSPERIRTALVAGQCSIMRDTRSDQRFVIPSKTPPDMDRVCRKLGPRRPERPTGSIETAESS